MQITIKKKTYRPIYSVPDELRSSLLSDASLGIETKPLKLKKKKSKKPEQTFRNMREKRQNSFYVRNGVKIWKMYWGPRMRHQKRWKGVLIPPKLKWFPSQCASFIFGLDMKPEYLARIVPEHFNPAVWEHRSDEHRALRVPKDREGETRMILAQKQFWFNTKNNRWYPRKLGPKRLLPKYSKFNPNSKFFAYGEVFNGKES